MEKHSDRFARRWDLVYSEGVDTLKSEHGEQASKNNDELNNNVALAFRFY